MVHLREFVQIGVGVLVCWSLQAYLFPGMILVTGFAIGMGWHNQGSRADPVLNSVYEAWKHARLV
jgi:hypothetical protein